jgi:hypothetical protein
VLTWGRASGIGVLSSPGPAVLSALAPRAGHTSLRAATDFLEVAITEASPQGRPTLLQRAVRRRLFADACRAPRAGTGTRRAGSPASPDRAGQRRGMQEDS